MAATYGPTWAQTTAAGGLGAVAGLSPAERMDEAMLQKQKQEQNALALDTTRLQQQRTGQLLEQEELNLRKLRDLEAYRTGANVSGAAAAPIVSPAYSGGTLTQASPSVFDPAAVQAGADYTQSNYQAAAFGGTPPAVITSDAAPAASAAKQPPLMRDAAKLVKDLEPVWANLESRFGLPEGYLRRTAEIESSLDPNAQNPNSSAGGLFQFIDGTAAEFNLENRFDPIQASNAAAKLASRNARILAGVLGRQPTAGELYLAHQQGAGGASVLLDPANQDKIAVDVVSDPRFVLLNGGDAYTSVAEFVKKWGKEKWAGDRYTFDQKQALNRGEGPVGLKGNIYGKKGLGLSINRALDEFYKPERNSATGEMDFSFPSPVEPKEATGLYPSGEEVLAAAEKTGARPGQRPLPATAGGHPIVVNTFTPEKNDIWRRFPNLTKQYMGVRTVDGVTYSLEGREADGVPFYINQETGDYVDMHSLQQNPDQRQLFKKLRDAFTGAGTSMIGSAGGVGSGPERSLEEVEQNLTDAINSANSNPTGATLQRVKDLTAEKKELVLERQRFKGVFRGERDVTSGEGPEAGITPEIEAANLKKLQDAEAKVSKVTATVTEVEQEAAAGTLTPTEIQAKIDAAVKVAVKTAGLDTSGRPKVDGNIIADATVYGIDSVKFAAAQTMIQETEGTLAVLEELQKLSRLAGDRTTFAAQALEIRRLRQNMISTKSYLKGMNILGQVKGGDLMPFVNLMANTYQTNNVELRETDGKWTLFINGQKDTTVNSMTANDISNHIGFLFDQDYKAAQIANAKTNVDLQQEMRLESHKAALTATTELAKATSKAQADVILERLKNSGKYQVIQTENGEAYLGMDETGNRIILYPQYVAPGLDLTPSPAVFIEKNGTYVPLQSN